MWRALNVTFLAVLALSWIAQSYAAKMDTRPCDQYASKADCPSARQKIQAKTRSLPACGGSNTLTRFAFIGDYGLASAGCFPQVAQLLEDLGGASTFSFVMNAGDNAYWNGACESYQESVAPYFGSYFATNSSCSNPAALDGSRRAKSPTPRSMAASTTTRFFPSIGNHDWDTYKTTPDELPYVQFFDFVRNLSPAGAPIGQYYSVDPADVQPADTLVPVPRSLFRLFALNSNLGAENNNSSPDAKAQQKWLEASLRASTSKFNLVFCHHSPFTTAEHDAPATWMRWPFGEWGASALLTGHEHVYERIVQNVTRSGVSRQFPYVVNGLGGHPWIYEIDGAGCVPVDGSQVRYNKAHGIMVGAASSTELELCFYSIENGGTLVDSFVISA